MSRFIGNRYSSKPGRSKIFKRKESRFFFHRFFHIATQLLAEVLPATSNIRIFVTVNNIRRPTVITLFQCRFKTRKNKRRKGKKFQKWVEKKIAISRSSPFHDPVVKWSVSLCSTTERERERERERFVIDNSDRYELYWRVCFNSCFKRRGLWFCRV